MKRGTGRGKGTRGAGGGGVASAYRAACVDIEHSVTSTHPIIILRARSHVKTIAAIIAVIAPTGARLAALIELWAALAAAAR
jgi:hypothetical protein